MSMGKQAVYYATNDRSNKMLIVIDNYPIIPFEQMGGFYLYSTIHDLKKMEPALRKKGYLTKSELDLQYEFSVVYETPNVYLFYNLLNGKLYKITSKPAYRGSYKDKLYVGMELEKAIAQFEDIRFEFEEVYTSEKEGIFFEPDEKLKYISIYVKEMETCSNKDFWDGAW